MKRAIIAHCWGGDAQYAWYPWVKRELELQGVEVMVPSMPDTENPQMDAWVSLLAEIVGKPDEELVLVGHSIGCATIMRYLENLEVNQKVGGVVFVAGFNENVGFDEIQNFFETPIDLEKIRIKSKNGFVAIHSDNDPFVDMKYADILKENLGAEVIVKHAAGHFSGSTDGEGTCLELPDVVMRVEKLLS